MCLNKFGLLFVDYPLSKAKSTSTNSTYPIYLPQIDRPKKTTTKDQLLGQIDSFKFHPVDQGAGSIKRKIDEWRYGFAIGAKVDAFSRDELLTWNGKTEPGNREKERAREKEESVRVRRVQTWHRLKM
ncbi:hypothetical protein K0M31_015239 [Melipona bicolor]|uniref:Uncharacterized protein n=1 Tax=Melipona bicolor TaxID=60889 RepID=A0AA40FFR0_9HYME|nr:hypothetical protein K0M31_015239 [Melipona bicolor]